MSMVGINNMSNDFNTTDFVAQMRGFQASDEARQRLFAVSHSLRVLVCPTLMNSVGYARKIYCFVRRT
jgi:hypothetical protein